MERIGRRYGFCEWKARPAKLGNGDIDKLQGGVMLVLTRKAGESVVLDGKIIVRVLGAQNGRVRLGIEAPDDVLVLREEVATRLGLSDAEREAQSELIR
jgi:carbon storage regulator